MQRIQLQSRLADQHSTDATWTGIPPARGEYSRAIAQEIRHVAEEYNLFLQARLQEFESREEGGGGVLASADKLTVREEDSVDALVLSIPDADILVCSF